MLVEAKLSVLESTWVVKVVKEVELRMSQLTTQQQSQQEPPLKINFMETILMGYMPNPLEEAEVQEVRRSAAVSVFLKEQVLTQE